MSSPATSPLLTFKRSSTTSISKPGSWNQRISDVRSVPSKRRPISGPAKLLRPYDVCKPFSTSAPKQRDHHFDTLKFVQRLKGEGFTEEQSKSLMLVLSDVIEESIQNLTRTMILKEGDRSTWDLRSFIY